MSFQVELPYAVKGRVLADTIEKTARDFGYSVGRSPPQESHRTIHMATHAEGREVRLYPRQVLENGVSQDGVDLSWVHSKLYFDVLVMARTPLGRFVDIMTGNCFVVGTDHPRYAIAEPTFNRFREALFSNLKESKPAE